MQSSSFFNHVFMYCRFSRKNPCVCHKKGKRRRERRREREREETGAAMAEEGERERERETKASFEYRGHLVVVLVGLLLLLGKEHWNKKNNRLRNQYTKADEPHRLLEERSEGEEVVKVKFEDLIDENFTIGSPEASRAREGGSRRRNLIPQKLHFTWKTEKLEELPEMFSTFQKRWRALHPSWEIKIWSDADQLEFVRRHYGDDTYWAALWSSSRARWFGVTPVMKADIFRYVDEAHTHHEGN